MPVLPSVAISKKGLDRWKHGHPWIYKSDVERAPNSLQGGEAVRVTDFRGHFLGLAWFSKASQISLRWLSWNDEPDIDRLIQHRLQEAQAMRQRLCGDETAYRMVHGEADLLPGLVVDRFGDALSVQLLTPAMEQRKEQIFDALSSMFKPSGIVNRSDAHVRVLEGLAQEKYLARGKVPDIVTYREGHIVLEANLLEGQKTGAFLDQRDNHMAAQHYASGHALDCFSYTGGFALQMALKAEHVTAVEISESACAQIKANAARNSLSNVEVLALNAFDFLRDALDEGRRFDTVVLDPPSFAKNKAALEAAARGYKEINLRAMQLLKPGGMLITASCTHHIDENRFEAMLDDAAADAKKRVQIIEKRGAGKDHPVLLCLRETRYLKCYVLRVW
jgi:23S rRNA (cytosine1962-C5)-methyltransferase